ncbi:Fic family protein [Myroides marinus]|uniref:Fic family protein n=1 Tax=Myroides marinus TaxID=703342 RepID=A0A1H6WSM9_9FLAO|nr:Fic family protein [Myroides marinus]MDM1360453.1 Fic family protein [Myroides marinus]MDM1370217.1 Fic family protein [Myroides marinus]MDM1373199.1 Fic family protein [Myroides marinus]MDM1377104.1 Fic family protein [Myroides marinus]MDM1380861.1 Fic family protein [Myroides marinus]
MTYTEVKINIDNLQQEVEARGGLNSEQFVKLSQKYRLECNYFSNSTEGNTLTKEEVRSMIGGIVNVDNKPLKDLMEIKQHDEVLRDMLGGALVEVHLSEKYIKELHAKLMYEESVEKKLTLGQWKQMPNAMITYKEDKYPYVGVAEVKAEMKELINRTNAAIDYILKGKKYAPHPIDVALNFHIDFLKISPFEKGNGIVARMLSNQILIAFVYTPFWITDKENKAYNQYIADVLYYEGAKDDLFGLIGQQILRSQQMVVDIQEGKSIEESDKFYNQIEMLKRQLKAREEEQSKVKSAEWLEKVFAHSIQPLFKEVEQNVKESFGDLFDDIKGVYTLGIAEEELVESIEEELVSEETETEEGDAITEQGEEEVVSEEEEQIEATEEEIKTEEETVLEEEEVSNIIDLENPSIVWDGVEGVQANYSLDGFKLIEGAEAIQVELAYSFTELTYVIELGNGTVFEKEYDQQLEATDIKAISDYTCESIVKEINNL